MPEVLLGLLWGSLFGGVFCLVTLAIGRLNAEMLVNSYPPDIQARFGPMRPRVRRQANIAGVMLLAALLAVVIAGVLDLRARVGLGWGSTFIFLLVMFQTWNLIDLVILDWLLLITLRPRFMILPGTEGLPGYRDYRYHFRKFVRGILLTAVMAGILTPVVMAINFFS